MMTYKIIDLQNGGYFADGKTFETKEAVRKQLISYHHDVDVINDSTPLRDVLEIGGWRIEEVEK